MDKSAIELLDWVESQIFGTEAARDVLERAPGLSPAEAYKLRDALMKRRVGMGDRHVGYKLGGASRSIRAQEHIEGPMVGCLMQSGVFSEAEPIAVSGYGRVAVEAEIGVLLNQRLTGPGLTLQDVLPALEAVFPAFEILRSRGSGGRSQQMRILSSNFTGGIVMGGPLTSPRGIDLRVEGMVLALNGEVQGSAAGVEVLGNPLNAVALAANTLAEYGACLEAGMVIMTGSFLGNLKTKPGDHVTAAYTRLGRVEARFA